MGANIESECEFWWTEKSELTHRKERQEDFEKKYKHKEMSVRSHMHARWKKEGRQTSSMRLLIAQLRKVLYLYFS